jgi:nucleoside-diphosphate-sugar epimerase
MFNVGRGEAVRCRDLAAMLLHISGQSTTLTEDADPPGRSAAVSWQQADITAITTRLGWHPRRSIGDAVERLWTGVPDRALAVGA